MAENETGGEATEPDAESGSAKPSVPAHCDPESALKPPSEETIEQVEAILEEMPEDKREIIEQVMFHQGPLPPAVLLRDYDLVVPGLAREIADGVIEERKFRHDMTRQTGNREFVLSLAGLGAQIIALLMMLGIVAYMVNVGSPAAAAAFGGAIIVGVIVALSNYRKSEVTSMPGNAVKKSEKGEKAE